MGVQLLIAHRWVAEEVTVLGWVGPVVRVKEPLESRQAAPGVRVIEGPANMGVPFLGVRPTG